jgi:Protein of unknown function (DUF1353)
MKAKDKFLSAWMAEEAQRRNGLSSLDHPEPMRRFGNVPPLQPFADMGYWFLIENLVWSSPHTLPSEVDIPRGFVTDFASVPRIFWSIFPPIGTYGLPAIMHDWLYWTQPVSRKMADEIFDVAMKDMRTPLWKRVAIYGSLRVIGWRAWDKNRLAKLSGLDRVISVFPNDPKETWPSWQKKISARND